MIAAEELSPQQLFLPELMMQRGELAHARRLLRPGMRLVLLSDGFSTDAEAALLLPQLAARHEITLVVLRDVLLGKDAD